MDEKKYKLPAVTVDVVLFTIDRGKLQCLLIKRKNEPFKDHWALPGGFLDVDTDKTLKDAAFRELKEETHLTPPYLIQIGAWGDQNRDPRMRVVSVVFYAVVPNSFKNLSRADDDAKELMWFNVHYDSSGIKLKFKKDYAQFAFDHQDILTKSIEILRRDIKYKPSVATLLPPSFSLAQLADIYEIIWDRTVNSKDLGTELLKERLISQSVGRLFYFPDAVI